jgi:hypothetical protein
METGLDDLMRIFSAISGGVWESLIQWWNLPFGEWLKRTGELILQFFGGYEFVRLTYGLLFKRRSRLEAEVELLENRARERNVTIGALAAEKTRLTAELKAARDELPGAAIARAERELGDFNQELAIGHLEKWFVDNADSIVSISKRLAQYHIARAVPDPGDHLRRAHDMLLLARGASPEDKEAQEISGELNAMNAALQDQLIREGEKQIAWNSAMTGGLTQGCSTLWNGRDFKQVIDARESSAVAVLAEGAGLV